MPCRDIGAECVDGRIAVLWIVSRRGADDCQQFAVVRSRRDQLGKQFAERIDVGRRRHRAAYHPLRCSIAGG